MKKCKSICAGETTDTKIAAASQEFIVDSIKTEAGQDLTGSLCQPVKVQVSESSRQKNLFKAMLLHFSRNERIALPTCPLFKNESYKHTNIKTHFLFTCRRFWLRFLTSNSTFPLPLFTNFE